jgi:hypothetical protein
MKKIIFIILVIAIAALFLVPESMIGEYKGLISLKYFLKDSSTKARSIVSSLIRGEVPEEFDILEQKAKEKLEQGKEEATEQVKDAAKDAATEAIEGL